MLRKKRSEKIDEVIRHGVNFEVTLEDMSRRSERRAWWVAASAIVMALILAGGYFYVMPLKEKVPYLVLANAYTGTSTVARLTDDTHLQRITTSDAINRSNVARFLTARESYDEAIIRLRDWKTVFVMSSAGVAAAYRALYSESNPDNPYAVYGRDRAIRVRILSIVLLGTDNGKAPTGATVRFQRSIYTKSAGTSQPLDGKIATLAFTYKSGLKMDEQDRVENPLGFQVMALLFNSISSRGRKESAKEHEESISVPTPASPDSNSTRSSDF